MSPTKISRWLRGHRAGGTDHEPLWTPQIQLDDGHTYLGFRDLMEVRVVDRFIRLGVSPQRIRVAISVARDALAEDRPLSTNRFRTDGRDIFLHTIEADEHGKARERLLNLFRKQYEFIQVMDPLLKTIEFDERGAPAHWWPLGRREHIVIDPERAFGRPIDAISSVPTSILAAAGRQRGPKLAAIAYAVPESSIRRAMKFEDAAREKIAA